MVYLSYIQKLNVYEHSNEMNHFSQFLGKRKEEQFFIHSVLGLSLSTVFMCIYTLSCSGLIFTKLSEIFKVLSSCKIFPEFALATCHDMLRLIIKSISGPDSFLVITVYCSPGEINTAG